MRGTLKVPTNAILSIPRSDSPTTLPEHIAAAMGNKTLSVTSIIEALGPDIEQFPPLKDRAYLVNILNVAMTSVIGPGGALLRDAAGRPVKVHRFYCCGSAFRVATSRDIRQEVLRVAR